MGYDHAAMIGQAIHDAIVIIDTILIHSYPKVLLFDCSSTHTFTTKAFVDRIGVRLDDLGYNLVVFTQTRA